MSFTALCTLDFGRICSVATVSRSARLVRPGKEPGFDDILWKAKSTNEMWQLLPSILNVHTSTEALVLEIETGNGRKRKKKHSPFSLFHSLSPGL